jgi:hypothetical protein
LPPRPTGFEPVAIAFVEDIHVSSNTCKDVQACANPCKLESPGGWPDALCSMPGRDLGSWNRIPWHLAWKSSDGRRPHACWEFGVLRPGGFTGTYPIRGPPIRARDLRGRPPGNGPGPGMRRRMRSREESRLRDGGRPGGGRGRGEAGPAPEGRTGLSPRPPTSTPRSSWRPRPRPSSSPPSRLPPGRPHRPPPCGWCP